MVQILHTEQKEVYAKYYVKQDLLYPNNPSFINKGFKSSIALESTDSIYNITLLIY